MGTVITAEEIVNIIYDLESSGNFLKGIILVLGILFFFGGSLELLLLEEGLRRKISTIIVFFTGILGIAMGMVLLILYLIIRI